MNLMKFSLLHHAARTDIAAGIVGILRGIDLYAARRAGMDELETASGGIHLGNDAHMADCLGRTAAAAEEHEVAPLEFLDVGDALSFSILRTRGVGQLDIVLAEHETGEARAVEPVRPAVPPAVTHAQILVGRGYQLVEQGIRIGLRRTLHLSLRLLRTLREAYRRQLPLSPLHPRLYGQGIARNKCGVLRNIVFIACLHAHAICRRHPCNDGHRGAKHQSFQFQNVRVFLMESRHNIADSGLPT